MILPSGYQPGKRYPLVVWVYGLLELSWDTHHFGGAGSRYRNLQVFATRGYAVLLPDSYLWPPAPMQTLAANILPGVDRVVELGIADAARIGVAGFSYGGYTAAALLAQTTRFRAAMVTGGVYDLWRLYGDLDAGGNSEGAAIAERYAGALPWTNLRSYIENNPIFCVERMTTPLLIIHGARDSVSVTQADALFVALRARGKTVEYARYPDEFHSFVNVANQSDSLRRFVAWFDKYLQPPLRDTTEAENKKEAR